MGCAILPLVLHTLRFLAWEHQVGLQGPLPGSADTPATLVPSEQHRAPSAAALQAGEGRSHQAGHHSHHDTSP